MVSVHTIVSFDFATSVIPGWHTTIFPPYFVAGAIFSGMAMVLTLMIVARKMMRLEDYITKRHIDVMCKLVLTTAASWHWRTRPSSSSRCYSGNPYEQFVFLNRAMGPYRLGLLDHGELQRASSRSCSGSSVCGRNLAIVFVLSLLVNVGMWFERFVIIVTSLHRDFLPSSWATYAPTAIEIATLVGSFGLFFTCFLLFCRFLPVIADRRVKGVLSDGRPRRGGRGMSRRILMGVFEDEADSST